MLEESSTTPPSIDSLPDKDAALLARLGYKQEFRRNFTPLEVFGIGFSIIGLVPSLASVLIFSIPYGGASAMVWGWMTCGIFLTIIALAMAELGSAAPTSGGLYYWTFMFSSPKWRCLLAWTVGYSNTVGNIASVASVDWGCAVQIMAAASIGSGLEFQATVAQTFGVYVALLSCHAVICSLNPAIVARLQTPFIIINILLCLAILIGVPASTPKEFINNAKYAFGNFTNLSGWNNGYAFVLSFLSPLWAIGAFDSTVHISEEATNANVAIPYAIILATTSSAILGWGLNVALAFCMGTDLESIIDNSIEQPMATILFNSFGQRGTLALWAFVVVVQFTMGTSMLTTCSRQIFAFSRDGALPFSRWLYDVSPRTHAPINCVWFAAFLSLLLGLLAFAGPAAIGAVFSLVVAAQYVAYSIPISARFLGGKKIKPGPFSLGLFSLPVAVIAVIWMVFIIIVFFFPASPAPGAANMNYTIVVLGGVLILAVAYFYFPKYGGRHWFKGPISTIGDMPIEEENGSDDDKTEKHGH
ncbi:amino acid transporter [Crucibulum laeve]|uniref:Amino acid transporter n=1 Tax=Crucibulum laeve TaxID=68775 RepID=A0A5C3LV80_9AGAR|nr:amino acid transporter [Crucibulum laeve]